MSEMKDFTGPFLGFSYDGTHSSNFKIVRINTGSRFEESLLPPIVDKALEIPGRDGKILQRTQYGPQTKKIDFAFDSMLEEDINNLKALFAKKRIAKLVYDERPERFFYAKPTGTNLLKFIPFDASSGEREDVVYKGEGTINFICYDPFAHKAQEIIGTSPSSKKGYEHLYELSVVNDGDEEAPFQLRLGATFFSNNPALKCDIFLDDELKMSFGKVVVPEGDFYVSVNSEIGLSEGLNRNYNKTGSIYDGYLLSGTYFKIPVGSHKISVGMNGYDPRETPPVLKFDCLYV